MQILVALGVGIVIYAVYGVFTADKSAAPPLMKLKIQDPPLPQASQEDPGREQKIQRLQSQVAKLESELEQAKAASIQEKSGSLVAKEKEVEFSVELKRREEWVAKAEAELAKIKAENLDLSKKFTTKENELQEEFTKNVNLTRELREIKVALEAKEMACRLKEDQLQVQKHQSESQLKSINEHLATIAEFKRKENGSEWVPKDEFNQLNAEYTKLEKELESSQERLKSFAVEIAHLRQAPDKKSQPVQEVKLTEPIPEEVAPPEAAAPEENPATDKMKVLEDILEKAALAEAQPEESQSSKEPKELEVILEETKALEEIKLPEAILEEIKTEEVKLEENRVEEGKVEEKTKETEKQ